MHRRTIQLTQPTNMQPPSTATLLLWNTFSTVVLRLLHDIHPTETIIAFDRPNRDLVQLCAQHFSHTTDPTGIVLVDLTAEYRTAAWRRTLNNPHARSMAIILLHTLEPYAALVWKYPRLLQRQTIVMIPSHYGEEANWKYLQHVSFQARLLILKLTHDGRAVDLLTWSLVDRKYVVLDSIEQLFQHGHPNVQLFWNTVERLPLPPVFRMDMLPPTHINTCEPPGQQRPERCYLYGPYVYLAQQLANNYRERYQPRMLPYTPGQYDDQYRILYAGYRKLTRAGAVALQNTRGLRDGFMRYQHAERMQNIRWVWNECW